MLFPHIRLSRTRPKANYLKSVWLGLWFPAQATVLMIVAILEMLGAVVLGFFVGVFHLLKAWVIGLFVFPLNGFLGYLDHATEEELAEQERAQQAMKEALERKLEQTGFIVRR